MKTITLNTSITVEIQDNVNPDNVGMHILEAQSFPIDINTGQKVGNILSFETDGYIEEEMVGLEEFEDK